MCGTRAPVTCLLVTGAPGVLSRGGNSSHCDLPFRHRGSGCALLSAGLEPMRWPLVSAAWSNRDTQLKSPLRPGQTETRSQTRLCGLVKPRHAAKLASAASLNRDTQPNSPLLPRQTETRS